MSFESMESSTALMFLKEATFYDKIVPQVNEVLSSIGAPLLRVPRFFYACSEVGRELIFFEDLRKKCFKMFDRRKGMDRKHSLLVFKELARLHSASKIMIERKGKGTISQFHLDKEFFDSFADNEITVEWFKSIPVNGGKMIEKCGDYSKAVEILNEMGPSALSLILDQLKPEEPFASVCHGDCWNNNLLFRYEEGEPVEVCLLDMQINRYSSVATDLRYFLLTSFNGDVRNSHLSEFLSAYYSQFSECMQAAKLKAPFTEEELLKEYKAKSTFGLLMCLMVIPAVLAETSEVIDYSGYTDEDAEKLIADSQQQLLKMVDSNPLMRPRLLDMIDEMIEEGILK